MKRRVARTLLALALLGGAATQAVAAALPLEPVAARGPSPEAQVKAAYIYKLASFVRWPGGGGEGFRFCIAGRSDVAAVLQDLVRGQRVGGHAASVVQLQASQGELARTCSILFLGRGAETATALIRATSGQPVLTVSDRGAGTRGGIIEFVSRDGRVRFTVDRALAEGRRLELNAKLMEVAVE